MVLFLVQVAKKIPMEDPNVLNIARGVYVLSNVIILGIYLYVKTKIDKKNGMPSPPAPRRRPKTQHPSVVALNKTLTFCPPKQT
jgi:hypothetical protein